MSLDLKLRAQRALQEKYRLDREIGRGGMAIVYRADDLRHSKTVALKLLMPAVADHLGIARFLREIRLASALVHPNIVDVLDTGEADGLPFYVMPLLDGPSLRGRRSAQHPPLTLGEVAELAAQVADALAYAHVRGVVHRDLKPENLLLHQGRVVVTDFGVGKALNVAGGSSLTDTGFIVGTPAYMSPEQAAGDPDLDARSDLYSLGIVLYELVGGNLPFTGKTAQQMIAQRFTGPPRALEELRSDIPPALAEIVHRLLAVRPAERFADAGEVADKLRHAIA